ncbi:hypothetical protein JW906_12465 [bacterium]|nr:hypothetical protein [bacterium]
MKSIIPWLVLFAVGPALFCSRNSTEPCDPSRIEVSLPEGPLRVVHSKLKTETVTPLHSNQVLEKTEYEYDGNGFLAGKTRILSDITVHDHTQYSYDDRANLIKEIIGTGDLWTDTIQYRYDLSDKLLQKITNHSTPDFVLRDTVFYRYDIEGNLTESFHRDPYQNYTKIDREVSEYSNGLLAKMTFFDGDEAIHVHEYRYFNEILTEQLYFTSHGRLAHRMVYYYRDGLLRKVKGFLGDDISDQKIFVYNDRYELIIQRVYVPPYSSFCDHEIHYEYY